MRIVIIGAGNTGKNLADKLCSIGHDVIVIDNDARALTNIEAELDVLTIQGNGSTPDTLANAEVAKADLVVAVTSQDEVNLLACYFARRAGIAHTIARISEMSYINSPLADLEKLGVDHAVSHNEQCAQEIFNVFRLPGTIEVTDLLGGKVAAVGIRLRSASPLLDKPLKEFKEEEWFLKVRFMGLVHDGKLEIPSGESHCREGDDVYVVLAPEETASFVDWIQGGRTRNLRKVVIVGGGDLGLSLAELLEETSIETVLIESDRDRAEYASEQLGRCLVINADATKAATLKELGTDAETAFAAVTGDEEMNIVSCLQATQLGVGFTVARIDNPEYVPIMGSLRLLDSVICPHLSLVRAILRFVRGENIIDVGLFRCISGELQEVAIKTGSKWAGIRLSRTKLPKGMIIAAVQRGKQAFVPTGDFILQENDRLAVYCLPETASKLDSVFK
jgi:trk system potassium uptake protein TrkA